MKKLRKHLTLLCIFLMCISYAYAAGAKIEIDTKSGDDIVEGLIWDIYKVADKDVYGNYNLLPDYAECEGPAENMTTAELAEIAYSLYNVAVTKDIEPTKSGVSDKYGLAAIEDLEKGVYVLSGAEYTLDYKKYTPIPAILEITGKEEDTIEIASKLTVVELPKPEPHKIAYSVEKVWVGDENSIKLRSDKVVIEIYCDGEKVEEVTLDESNKWTYEWEAEEGHEWNVLEKDVPENYKVLYTVKDTDYKVNNTLSTTITPTPTPSPEGTPSPTPSPEGTPTPTPTVPGKLPQSGQLNWPIPVLALAGLILIGIGVALAQKAKKD